MVEFLDPGLNLRAERELRSISLEELSKATKISLFNLKLLEENRYDEFPDQLYAKGYLKSYITYLGLDSEKILLEYEYLLASGQISQKKSDLKKQKARIKSRRLMPVAGLLILTPLLLMFLFPANDSLDATHQAKNSALYSSDAPLYESDFRQVLAGWADQKVAIGNQYLDGLDELKEKTSTIVLTGHESLSVKALKQTWFSTLTTSNGKRTLECLLPEEVCIIPLPPEIIIETEDPFSLSFYVSGEKRETGDAPIIRILSKDEADPVTEDSFDS